MRFLKDQQGMLLSHFLFLLGAICMFVPIVLYALKIISKNAVGITCTIGILAYAVGAAGVLLGKIGQIK